MKIGIIGAGWYGMHSAIVLQKKHDITIFEKESEIFTKSSFYNQNRLHSGYHYPRCSLTRNMCNKYYDVFIDRYKELVEDISLNAYFISKSSVIDYETYKIIYSDTKYKHTIINNNLLNHVYPEGFEVNEKIINNVKTKEFFKQVCNNYILYLNFNVITIDTYNDNKLIINNEHVFDYILDCTNNNLNLSKFQYIYENTISLLYKKKKKF